MESLGIAGISNHSLLFSRTAPVPEVTDEELTRWGSFNLQGHSWDFTFLVLISCFTTVSEWFAGSGNQHMWATHTHVPLMNKMWTRMSSQNLYLLFKCLIVICLILTFIFFSSQFAINPKDVSRSKHISPKISNKLTESEIKQQINRLSQVYANKVSYNYNLQVYANKMKCFSFWYMSPPF